MSTTCNTTAQHCCSLHAWLSCLFYAKGDYAVIIHSDKECSALIPDMIEHVDDVYERFYCTNLAEQELISGKGLKKLERAIMHVIETRKPSMVLVLSSCPTLLVGEDVEGLCRKLQKRSKTRIEYRKTSGFSSFEPKQIMDDCLALLLSIQSVTRNKSKKPNDIALVGFNMSGHYAGDYTSLKREVCELTGARVAGCLSSFMSIPEIKSCVSASTIFTVDETYYKNSAELCNISFGIAQYEVPYPVSITTTMKFMIEIARRLGTLDSVFNKKLAVHERKLLGLLASFRKKINGMRLFYGIASALDYSVITSAHEGLCFLPFFQELGFSVTLLIQGNPEKKEDIETLYRSMGIEYPVHMFGHCGDAHTFLPENEKVLVFGSDMLQEQVENAGHYFMEFHDLHVGFKGVAHNFNELKKIGVC